MHLDQFGHVGAEEGVDPLRLSVSVHVQLDVCREAPGNRITFDELEVIKKKKRRFLGLYLPGAGRAPRRGVGRQLAAEPVSVEVGGGVVGAQALAVALADFGQDVDPVARLHAVVGLDVERSLRLDDLEHLEEGKQVKRSAENKHFKKKKREWEIFTFFILKDSSSRRSTAKMFSMGMLHRAPSPGGDRFRRDP